MWCFPAVSPELPQYTTPQSILFVAVFLGCTSTGRVGLGFMWFYVQELPKAQPAVVLVLKRLRKRLKVRPKTTSIAAHKPLTFQLPEVIYVV